MNNVGPLLAESYHLYLTQSNVIQTTVETLVGCSIQMLEEEIFVQALMNFIGSIDFRELHLLITMTLSTEK